MLVDGWYGRAFFCGLDQDSEGLQQINPLARHQYHQLSEL